MDGDEKEVGCDNKTHSVGVCARGRSTDGNSVSIIVVILCVLLVVFLVFVFFCFSFAKLKGQFGWKDVIGECLNGTLKQLLWKIGFGEL